MKRPTVPPWLSDLAPGWLRSLGRRSFVRSVVVVATGTAAGQAITVLVSPLLTRLYDPAEFGILAVYVAILGVVSMIASLCYEIAIPLPSSDRRAANVLAVALVTLVAVAGLSALGVWITRPYVDQWTNTPGLGGYVWLVPVGVLFLATYQAWNYWAIRKRAFPLIANTKLRQGLGSSGTQVGLGVLGFGPIGLIVGQIVGQAAGITTLVRGAFDETPDLRRYVTKTRMRWAALRYRRFPILYSWAGLANALGLRLPILLMAGLHGTGAAGTFLLADRVVGAPMKLIGTAVGQVYFGRAAELVDDRMPQFQKLFRRLTVRLLVLGALGAGVVALGGPALFGFVLGREWGAVGTYVRVLGAMYVAQFAVGPLSQTLAVLERQGVKLAWETVRLLGVAAAFGAAWLWSLDPVWTLAAYTAVSVASLLLLYVLTDLSIRESL